MRIKDEREELERMVKGSADEIGTDKTVPKDQEELKMEPSFDIDYAVLKRNCQRKARRMIKNGTGLMLSDDMVKQNPYLRNKMQMDIISLSGLLYQLNVNEVMQESLMEDVRLGAAHPRMYEVFGNLSKTIGDLNKQLLQTVEAIKLTYKDVKGDIREKEEELKAIGDGSSVFRNKDGLVSKGTKDLIKEARKLKQRDTEDIQDIEEIKE